MKNPNFSQVSVTFASVSTPTTFTVFTPQYKCDKARHSIEEIRQWVKESCRGGWQIKESYYGQGHLWLSSESDYALYLLTWS